MALEYLGTGNDDGTIMGRATSELIGFYGTTPVSQRASSDQATVTTSASFGTTQALLLNQLRDMAVQLGFIKGAA